MTKEELQRLQRDTGLRVYMDAPDGIEVHDTTTHETVATVKSRPLLKAFLKGYLAGKSAETPDPPAEHEE